MTTEYLRTRVDDSARRALAERIVALRRNGVPWDGPGPIVAQDLVSGAPQGRDLLRRYGVVGAAGRIRDSYTTSRDGRPRAGTPRGRRSR